MTAPEPTRPADEHTDAVARALCASEFEQGWAASEWDEIITNQGWYRSNADAILTSTDAAVHLAMLDALVRAGVLLPERTTAWERRDWPDGPSPTRLLRHATEWEVAP